VAGRRWVKGRWESREQVGRESSVLELEGIEATPRVVTVARRGLCRCSSEHSMHVFAEPTGPRSDSTKRGRIGRYDLKIQRPGFHCMSVTTHSFITRSYLRPGENGGIDSSKTSGHAQAR